MTYAIIGSGAIGTALATQFARNDIDVLIANSRGAASLAGLAGQLGSNIKAVSVQEALKADIVILAHSAGRRVSQRSREGGRASGCVSFR